MGQKVNPIGMRLQVNRTWDSRWYADTAEYGDLLLEDIAIRDFIKEECKQAGVSRVIIERPHKKCRITIHTPRPRPALPLVCAFSMKYLTAMCGWPCRNWRSMSAAWRSRSDLATPAAVTTSLRGARPSMIPAVRSCHCSSDACAAPLSRLSRSLHA